MMYDKLIEKLRDDTMWQNCEFDFIYSYMHEAADAIEELQKRLDNAEIENIKLREEFAKYRGKNRLIPVTERLPENKHEAYLCRIESGRYCEVRWTDRFFGLDKPSSEWGWHFLDLPKYCSVTHWMPLPEPPESERSNED